jgi:hypothetical protein
LATEPTPYPWVNFLLNPVKAIDSTPLNIFSSPKYCIVDSIFVANTSERDIYIDITVTATRDDVEEDYTLFRKVKLPKNGRMQLMQSVIHMQSGDIIKASSDFSGNTFDCHVSYRELTEQSAETAEEPFSYPWVNFMMTPLRLIDSTPTLSFGSVHDCIIDSIYACNLSGQEMFLDVYTLTERNLVAENNYIARRENLKKDETKDLIFNHSSLQMQAGDLLYINSDFAGNPFDCLVSYREIRKEQL